MIRKIASTTLSRALITVSGFVVLLMNTRELGSEKLGQLALYLIILNLLIHVGEIVGGSALVYLQKKFKLNSMMSLAYVWSLIVVAVASLIIHWFVPVEMEILILILIAGLIQSFAHVHLYMLIGKEKLKAYNLSTFLQAFSFMLGLILAFYVLKWNALSEYLLIYLLSQVLMFSLTLWYLKSEIREGGSFHITSNLIRELFNYGFVIQLANVFQFGVYRLNYIILEMFTSTSTLGIYSIGNQISEKALIPGKAISLVQYSKISNTEDIKEAARLSVQLLNLNHVVTGAMVLVLILLPTSFIEWIFGREFGDVKIVFLCLAPGIIALALSSTFSHFFAGLGKYKLNAITSFMGLVLMTILAYITIPTYGMKGAAITSSIVYTLQVIVQALLFRKVSGLKWRESAGIFLAAYGKYTWKKIRQSVG